LPVFLSSGVKWEIGGPGNGILFLIPLKPSEKMALKAKCGIISAPGIRISKRVALGGAIGGQMMRIDAARESKPYVTAFGAQKASPPTRRL